MESRRYERLRRDVSRLGLAATGLYKRPDVDPSVVARVIGEAIDRGVNVVDTAPYLGDSEALCGQTLRELHAWEKILLVTRLPPASAEAALKDLLADQHGVAYRDPLPKIWSPAYLEDRVERSLRATKLEVIPLMLLEGWHDSWLRSTAWPEIHGAMHRLQRRGKVLHWGLQLPASALPHTAEILDEPLITAVAAPYGLWSAAAEGVAAAAAERNIAFFAQLVMGQGGLSGEIMAAGELRADDVRSQRFGNAEGRIELSRRIAELAAFTKAIPPAAESSSEAREILEASRRDLANRECETVAELAVRFTISNPSVASAVIGTSSAPHLRSNAAAVARGALPEHVMAPLREWMAKYVPPPVRDDDEDDDDVR
jgi:aryl-alcohol dehydrogenase-like predicted oxidoreductase